MSPAASAALAASQPSPRRSAASHSSVGSPSGSAAARVNKSRESAGNDLSRFANPSSSFPSAGTALVSASPSASSAVVHVRGSSNSASGFP